MAGWLPSQPANLTLIRSKNARLGSSLACLATNVCIGLKKSRLFLYQIVDGLAFLCRPLMWNESILVKGAAASCLYSTLLGVTLSVHCVGEQSDPTLLFQGLLQFCSCLSMQPNWRTCCLPLRGTCSWRGSQGGSH